MPNRILRGTNARWLAADHNIAAVKGVCAKDGTRQFSTPRPYQPRDTQNLATPHGETNVAKNRSIRVACRSLTAEVAYLKCGVAILVKSGSLKKLDHRAPDHHADNVRHVDVDHICRSHITAIAQNRDAVTDFVDFFQPVRDED